MNQHKALCNINLRCAVIHPDGICPGPYGKCNCGVEPNSSNINPPLSTTNTSDWRKRFAGFAGFVYQNYQFFRSGVKPKEIETFIKKEIERAREEGVAMKVEDCLLTVGIKGFEKGQIAGEELGRLKQIAEVKRLIEGMKANIRAKEGNDTISETGKVVYFYLSDLLTKLTDTK